MAPILAEVGATIVGAAAPNTTLDELKLKPVKLGVICRYSSRCFQYALNRE